MRDKQEMVNTSYGRKDYLLRVSVLFITLVIALFIAVKVTGGLEFEFHSTSGGFGKPRVVDIEKVRLLIWQHKLSDKDAMFYEQVSE